MIRLCLRLCLAALVLAAACSKGDRNKSSTNANPASTIPPAYTAPVAPASVPQSVVDRITREWPDIEAAGKAFETALDEATTARDAGDRDRMDIAITEANKMSNKALETWGAIAYSIEDMADQKVKEACLKYIRDKDKIVSRWMEKAKALAQFSRVAK